MRIIPRAEWGARFPRGFGPAPLPATEVWLHHSVTAAPDPAPPFADDDAAVRTLESIGQQRFGGGISYTFAVTPSPTVNSRAAQEAELNADEARMLAEIHFQTTGALPNRRGPQGNAIPNGGADTLFGYAINSDGAGFRVEREVLPQILTTLHSIENRLAALKSREGADA